VQSLTVMGTRAGGGGGVILRPKKDLVLHFQIIAVGIE
jgi:hypothetical protein